MSTITTAPPSSGALLTPADLAERWSISVGTLANDRSAGRGLSFVRVGARIRYARIDVEAYEAAHRVAVSA